MLYPRLALAVLSCTCALTLSAEAGGVFTPVPTPMSSGRYLHSATLLASGDVLIAGGYNGSFTTDSAELFDPDLGTFITPMTMSVTRSNHTATLLQTGQVLLAGGFFAMDAAELYDGSFTPLSPGMTSPRADHVAALLGSGRVLIAGGFATSTATNTAELYDPVLGTFTSLSPETMTSARESHTATVLQSGKVLVAGGGTDAVFSTNTAELFDPVLGTFTSLSPATMTSGRTVHTATLLQSGKVLLTGGLDEFGQWSDTAERFDPALGTFTALSPMTLARAGHEATLLPSGRVLITGGQIPSGVTDTAELFDPVLGTFTSLSPATMSSPRAYHTATSLASGKVLIAGGQTGIGNTATATADIFDEGPVPVELSTFTVE